MSAKRVVGILGGMGPAATVYFYQRIINQTQANKDQDHIPVLIYSNTQIPDRMTCILSEDFEAIEASFIDSVKAIERGGAECLSIPCNTAHYFSDLIEKHLSIPFFHLVKETATVLSDAKHKTVGLLGTTGTVKTRLYHDPLEASGITCLTPTEALQEQVQATITAVKAGNITPELSDTLKTIGQTLLDQGAEKLILGCTELPLLVDTDTHPIYIDPMEVLADRVIGFSEG